MWTSRENKFNTWRFFLQRLSTYQCFCYESFILLEMWGGKESNRKEEGAGRRKVKAGEENIVKIRDVLFSFFLN